jgi:hypothetical protein
MDAPNLEGSAPARTPGKAEYLDAGPPSTTSAALSFFPFSRGKPQKIYNRLVPKPGWFRNKSCGCKIAILQPLLLKKHISQPLGEKPQEPAQK